MTCNDNVKTTSATFNRDDVAGAIYHGPRCDDGAFEEWLQATFGRFNSEEMLDGIREQFALAKHDVAAWRMSRYRAGCVDPVRTYPRLLSEEALRGCIDPLHVHVTAYRVERRRGGPEEGGWYYDHWSPLETRTVPRDGMSIACTVQAMRDEYELPEGARRSWAAKYDREFVVVEDTPRAHETLCRPRYC